jgi:tetratricopeptide (TPR) repeat protein
MVTSPEAVERATVIAFYSYAGGAGRSCTVANVALILASYGYHVLVADLDLQTPSLHRYLGCFMPDRPEPAEVPAGTPLMTAFRLNCDFVNPRGSLDFFGPTTDAAADPVGFAVGREELTRSGYDYVLIDSPAGATPFADAVTEDLADVLVVGYSLNKQAMDRAVQRAYAVQRGRRGHAIRILPVPMRVDQSATGTTTRMRGEGRRQFAWLLADMEDERRLEYWDKIEIPYVPDYAVEEGLPFLDDSSDQRDHLVRAYLDLTAMLVPETSSAEPGKLTGNSLRQYRESRLAAAGSNVLLTVLHTGADRYWAEWLVAELQRMGLTARRERIDSLDPTNISGLSSVLLIVSKSLLALFNLNEYLNAIAGSAAPGGQVPLAVSIDKSKLPARQFPTIGYLPMAGGKPDEALQNLASYYEVTSGFGLPTHSLVHYPGSTVHPGNLPARSGTFHGRDNVIDEIRDYLMSPAGKDPLTLTGPPGIGKSQLALEYAHRFAAYYDLIFFIRADSAEAVQIGLADLADETQVARQGDAPKAALRKLQSDQEDPFRWLLIYDGADAPAHLAGFLPTPGYGHVLVTSRTQPAEWPAHITVRPLDQRAADGALMDLIPDILPDDARRLAVDLHEVPLALKLAAAWIDVTVQGQLDADMNPATATSGIVTMFRQELARAASEEDAASRPAANPVNLTVALLVELLGKDDLGAAATCLLETCAFLAPIGMSVRLLRSPGMLAQLIEVDRKFTDPVVLNNVLRVLTTYGFSLLGTTSRAPLQVHPLVLEVVRAQLPPERRAERSAAVVRMLSASAPLDIDDDTTGNADVYAELQQHLEPSGAWRQMDFAVRRWMVNQVRYLWQTETVRAWDAAAELAERLARYWAEKLPDKEDDPLLLRLQTQLANVYRSRCDFDRARDLDEQVLYRQRRVLGLHHLRTLMTARSYGADLRLVGDFQGALLEEQSTWQAFSQTLGDDHLMTIVASSNLALSELMAGEPEQALQRQDEDLIRSQRIASERSTQTPWILFHTGTLLRELGRYDESRERLSEARQIFDDLIRNGTLAPTVWVVLRTAAGLAMTERRLGRPSLKQTESALQDCRSTYGDLYPDVLAISISRAGALHAESRGEEAVEQARQALEGYQAVFGEEHPFTWLCEVDLGIYALAAGQTELADQASGHSWSALEQGLTRYHLWSLAAAVSRANVLVVTDRLEQARSLEQQTLADYQRRMGRTHPFTHIAENNLAHTRRLEHQKGTKSPAPVNPYQRKAIELDAPPY